MRSRPLFEPFVRAAFATLLLTTGCDKSPAAAPPPAPSPAPTPSATPVATPTTEKAPEPSATTTTMATAAPSSSVAAGDAGKPKGSTAGLKPASKQIQGKNFALELASPGCKAGDECAVTIKLLPAAEYHVNKEYPYKFIATPAPGVTFLGKADPNTFTRSSGDFVEQGEKTGLMSVRFKPAAAGEAKVAGKYKLSVCSAAQCQIEEEMVDLAVPVM